MPRLSSSSKYVGSKTCYSISCEKPVLDLYKDCHTCITPIKLLFIPDFRLQEVRYLFTSYVYLFLYNCDIVRSIRNFTYLKDKQSVA